MGCYDSSILRPLLGNNGSGYNNNEADNRRSRPWFAFWKHKQGYNGMDEDSYDLDRIKNKTISRKSQFINCDKIMSAIRKIGLLVWKNLLLRRRHYIVTVLEILLPTLFALVLVYGKSQVTTHTSTNSSNPLATFLNAQPDIFPPMQENEFPISCGAYTGIRGQCLVAFAPNNTETVDLMNQLIGTLSTKAQQKMDWRGFESEVEIEKFVASLSFNEVTGSDETLRAAIIFQNGLRPLGGVIGYKIRMMDNSQEFPGEVMSSHFPWLQLPGPDYTNAVRYKESGFTAFQLHVDKVLLQKFASSQPNQQIVLQPFPYPPHERNLNFSEFYFIILPNVIILGFIFIVPSILRGVVNERETGIKELMKLCGIPNWMHWVAWTINSMLFLSISVLIVVVLFFSDYLNPDAGAVLTNSNPFLWFVVLTLYALSSTAFCFFVSSFFHRPTIAITVGIILWLTTYYAPSVPLGDSNRYLSLSLFDKMFVALLPNMALYWALKVMCGFEGRASGAQWSNLFEPLSSTDTLTLGHVIFMFLVDTVLYILLSLYVEAIIPAQYGIRKPWYFIFQPSFWTRSKTGTTSSLITCADENENSEKPGFELEPEGRHAGVVIKNLRKVFSGNKEAVAGVSMKMYDGEIFALLGHNGAGKTTTISACIGLISPTSGTAFINDCDIRSQMDQCRESLGLCPQHNLLFDELTVDEHLTFFGRLKGLSSTDAKVERVEMLKKLQLTEKTNTLAKALSGGQKRKLCLGMSMIGKAKVLFLDEVTTGLDVEARRAIWDLLLEERAKQNRTIILTTHFLEEADILGDRIGIMAHGKLQCVGTSLFLKKFYGAGYTLSMTMKDKDVDRKRGVLSIVQKYVPTSTFKEDSQGSNSFEVSIVIPTESFSTSIFPIMFKDLQDNQQSLGIRTIGMSLTTMDEVFVKADELASDSIKMEGSPTENTNLSVRGPKNGAIGNFDDSESNKENSKNRLQGIRLIQQQFMGLLIKRLRYTMRKWILVLTQITIPVFILIIAIVAGNSQLQPPISPKPLKIDIDSFHLPITLYSTSDESMGRAFASIVGPSAKLFTGNGTYDLVQGLISSANHDLARFRERHIVAAQITPEYFKAMYSTIAYHASPLALNLGTNTLLRSNGQQNLKIEVTNHPLQGGFDYLLQALQPDPAFSVSNALMFGALAPIGLALLAASYTVSPLEERLCKGKQLQLMTGVHPIIYWGSSFVWDFFVMTVVIIIMVACFPIFQKGHTYTSYGGAGAIFVVLLAYGYSAIPFSYISSLFSQTVPGGFSFVTIIHIATGMILPFVVYILEATPTLSSIADTIRIFGRFFPTFGASLSTMRFVEIALKNSRCSLLPDNAESLLCDPNIKLEPHYRHCCSNCPSSNTTCMTPTPYISWHYQRAGLLGIEKQEPVPGIGQELIYLFLLGIGYQIILILLEFGFIQRIAARVFRTNTEAFDNNPDDHDVDGESTRVHDLVRQGKAGDDALVVEDLCKNYGSLAAVANLSFGVHHGECFGLLGVNGAGKTTTFRMLTGDEIRSNGNAYASNFNLEISRKQFLANIGYCPQFDGIVGVLTGSEMVELFGRLRGVENVPREAEKWLKRVGLTDSRNVQCRKYSGGMKRRLSAAMAMVGDPEIVLLDEPTSGVDPVSRREFWKIISSIRESGRAIILTSHSMEEITACCSRLGIMVNGQLQCIGGVQHLKNKFAQGYSLSIKLKPNTSLEDEQVDAMDRQIISKYSQSVLKDKHQTTMQYHIKDASLAWDTLFSIMEELKLQFPNLIEDYSITETTLEEVFLSFARKQYGNREANISFLKKIVTCQCCQ